MNWSVSPGDSRGHTHQVQFGKAQDELLHVVEGGLEIDLVALGQPGGDLPGGGLPVATQPHLAGGGVERVRIASLWIEQNSLVVNALSYESRKWTAMKRGTS